MTESEVPLFSSRLQKCDQAIHLVTIKCSSMMQKELTSSAAVMLILWLRGLDCLMPLIHCLFVKYRF